MSNPSHHPLMRMIAKLQCWVMLGETDRAALLALPHSVRRLKAQQHIVWDGDRPENACVLLSGYAVQHKIVGTGGRQIVSIHLAGDPVDVQNALLARADYNVQMLTDGDVAFVPIEAIRQTVSRHSRIGLAFWYDTVAESAIFREWIVNVGRRNADVRIAHLLCEFATRLERRGLGSTSHFLLPMTQEQIADAASLTPVHVNRTLKRLELQGLIIRDRRSVTIPDWGRLIDAADFDPAYLHLDHVPFPISAGRAPVYGQE